ncbi:hypothetical protein [Nocardioides montaniterrae]
MRMTLGTLAAALLALSCAACGSGGGSALSKSPSSPSGPGGESTSTTGDDTGLTAKLVAGVPPKDLTWSVPREVPADWHQLRTETGTLQWQIGTSRCTVTLNQPSGLGTRKAPDSDQIASDYAADAGRSLKMKLTISTPTQRMFANHVNKGAAEAQSQLSVVELHSASGVEGEALGYRAGDYALRALGVCGTDWAEHRSAIEQFFSALGANTTY